MKPVFIYALNCPLTGVVRYCGQTVDPDKRLRRHVTDAHKEGWRVSRWIKKLLSSSLRPVMEILDVVPDNEADFWECEYIQNFRERGFDLTNGTEGGDGFKSGDKHPNFGKKLSPEHVSKLRAAHLGQLIPQEQRIKISESLRGRKFTTEHLANLKTAAKSGPEHHLFGKKQSPGLIAKRSGKTPWNKGMKNGKRIN